MKSGVWPVVPGRLSVWPVVLGVLITLSGCRSSDFDLETEQEVEEASLFQLSDEGGFVLPLVPDSNPLTNERIELGQHLFYDARLSGNQTQSCESCHFQHLAFTDGKALPTGSTGEVLARNSQTLTNVAYNATYTWWNPIFIRIEQQLALPLSGDEPVELGINDANQAEVLQRLSQDERYQTLFDEAFPEESDPYTLVNVTKALAAFTRILISDRSPFDRNELSDSASRGKALFFSEKTECFHCHNGTNFSSSTVTANTRFAERPFFNTGLYNLNQDGSYPADNTGKYQVTNDWIDMGAFRPPTLRNVELTAPYMHDGSIETLEDVMDFYAAGGRNITAGTQQGDGRLNPYKSDFVNGFDMTEDEKTDLINFLKSLTDQAFITDERFANPWPQEVTP